ncbi:MAG: radical SAM protein [bacterium]|nr:radical SAM protein [bacterium]
MKKIKKILLMQPNYSILGKRSWRMMPYNLGILKACLGPEYETAIFDPNFSNMGENEIRQQIRDMEPDVVGITSFSTEYIEEIKYHAALVKKELPNTIVVVGGVLPTVMIEKVVNEPDVDYFVIGEGEHRFPRFLEALNNGGEKISQLDGIAFMNGNESIINYPKYFIQDLDSVPFPDYGPLLNMSEYGNHTIKYAHILIPRQYPFATTISSRGCPYKCIFCAASTVSGVKVRMRSTKNILQEIDWLCNDHGIREIIFVDDHFLHGRKRAREVMQGIIDRKYGITWKCSNVAIFSLNHEIMELMRSSGCYQLTVSIESGDQDVLSKIIKKPVNLKKAVEVISLAKSLGFEIISNFILGLPGETWDQIRRTIAFADELDIDMVNFHIATPMPKTRLMDVCLKEGFITSEDDALSGYTHGIISTSEFSNMEVQILRAFEWDRINFKTPEKIENIANMEGVTVAEVADWRKRTRKNLGATVNWKE